MHILLGTCVILPTLSCESTHKTLRATFFLTDLGLNQKSSCSASLDPHYPPLTSGGCSTSSVILTDLTNIPSHVYPAVPYLIDWNWKKVTMLGHTLIHKLKDAVICTKSHGEELTDLEHAIDEVHLTTWTSKVEAWEEDNSKLDPFESHVTSMTQTVVRLQLARNEARDLDGGIKMCQLHADTTALGAHATETQRTNLCMQGNALWCKIETWTVVQALYMPAAVSLHAVDLSVDSALVSETKKMANKLKYDHVHSALLTLRPLLGKVVWEESLCVLHITDMHPLGDIAPGQSEGTQDISWIWKAPGALHNDDAGIQDCLHIELCKAQAHANRWSEEVLLLLEEMCRVIEFSGGSHAGEMNEEPQLFLIQPTIRRELLPMQNDRHPYG
ncbi:hypothetical protein BDR05DRAFT_951418 [Suillus weaverae]|nr:hypothetical protein BDR05DRAFT_951418 [Suillus weaverae]